MKLSDMQFAGMAFAVFCVLAIGMTFFVIVYVCNMLAAILHTPEPGWEWAGAWEGTKETFRAYWRWFSGE